MGVLQTDRTGISFGPDQTKHRIGLQRLVDNLISQPEVATARYNLFRDFQDRNSANNIVISNTIPSRRNTIRSEETMAGTPEHVGTQIVTRKCPAILSNCTKNFNTDAVLQLSNERQGKRKTAHALRETRSTKKPRTVSMQDVLESIDFTDTDNED